jgi:hypothetical protein
MAVVVMTHVISSKLRWFVGFHNNTVHYLVDIFSQNALVGLILGVSVANRTLEKHTPQLISIVIARLVLEVGDVYMTLKNSCDEIGLRVCTKYCFLSWSHTFIIIIIIIIIVNIYPITNVTEYLWHWKLKTLTLYWLMKREMFGNFGVKFVKTDKETKEYIGET